MKAISLLLLLTAAVDAAPTYKVDSPFCAGISCVRNPHGPKESQKRDADLSDSGSAPPAWEQKRDADVPPASADWQPQEFEKRGAVAAAEPSSDLPIELKRDASEALLDPAPAILARGYNLGQRGRKSGFKPPYIRGCGYEKKCHRGIASSPTDGGVLQERDATALSTSADSQPQNQEKRDADALPVVEKRGKYINYGAMSRNIQSCSRKGNLNQKCRAQQPANPYTKGCSVIKQCRGKTNGAPGS